MKTARAKHVPTDETRKHVLIMAGLNVPLKRIVAPMGISIKTLKRDYARELREGFAHVCEVADKSLLNLMAKGNLGAIVWFDKTRRGMREPTAAQADANRPAAAPIVLGISFEKGGPGRVRKTPYDMAADPNRGAAPGADRRAFDNGSGTCVEVSPALPVDVDEPTHEPIVGAPAQEYLPRSEPKSKGLSDWERLAPSPVDQVEHPEARADAALRYEHTHSPKADSTCRHCRQLWSNS